MELPNNDEIEHRKHNHNLRERKLPNNNPDEVKTREQVIEARSKFIQDLREGKIQNPTQPPNNQSTEDMLEARRRFIKRVKEDPEIIELDKTIAKIENPVNSDIQMDKVISETQLTELKTNLLNFPTYESKTNYLSLICDKSNFKDTMANKFETLTDQHRQVVLTKLKINRQHLVHNLL